MWACCPAGGVWGQGPAGTGSPQACLRAARDGETALGRRGEKKSFIVCSPLCAKRRGWGEGSVSLSPAVPWGLPWGQRLKLIPEKPRSGRRKAVRDRLALQGGTGDFP